MKYASRRVWLLISCVALTSGVVSAAQNAGGDRARQVLDQLRQEKYAEVIGQFTGQMAAVNPDQLGQMWKGLSKQFGEFKSEIERRTQQVQGNEVVTLGCQFEQGAMDLIVTFDTANKIVGLRFTPRPAAGAPPPAR